LLSRAEGTAAASAAKRDTARKVRRMLEVLLEVFRRCDE
jgi:hypothetical protein